MAPSRSRWPKISPRRLQDDPKMVLKGIFSHLKIDFDFDSFWDRFWLRFGSPKASLWGPKNRPKIEKINQKNDQKFDCSKCRLKIVSRPPKTLPGPPQERPQTPQDHPKTTQELPKRPPRPPKMPSRAPKIASRLPKMLPRDPKVAPRYRDISFGWLPLHNARIRTNNERMMNE